MSDPQPAVGKSHCLGIRLFDLSVDLELNVNPIAINKCRRLIRHNKSFVPVVIFHRNRAPVHVFYVVLNVLKTLLSRTV
jgi:hypothetical protein